MLLPWLFPQTKRNNFAAKVNSENQEKLLILRKEDASASSGQKRVIACADGIKAGSRQQLLAGIRVPALQGGLQRRPEVPSEWNRQRAAPAVRHLPEP